MYETRTGVQLRVLFRFILRLNNPLIKFLNVTRASLPRNLSRICRAPCSSNLEPHFTSSMHVASDSDLRASLQLADGRYDEVRAKRAAERRADRRNAREDLKTTHGVQEKA